MSRSKFSHELSTQAAPPSSGDVLVDAIVDVPPAQPAHAPSLGNAAEIAASDPTAPAAGGLATSKASVGVGHSNTRSASSSAAISNLDIHDDIIRKRAVHSQRAVSAAKVRRSARIAEREAPFYLTMSQKAARLKAAKFLGKASVELAAAVQGSSLCDSDADASDVDDAADKLAQIALICGADADEADAIRAAGALPSP